MNEKKSKCCRAKIVETENENKDYFDVCSKCHIAQSSEFKEEDPKISDAWAEKQPKVEEEISVSKKDKMYFEPLPALEKCEHESHETKEEGDECYKNTHPEKSPEGWIEQFDILFDHYNPIHDKGDKIPVWNGGDYKQLKDFIRKQISESYERGKREEKERIKNEVAKMSETGDSAKQNWIKISEVLQILSQA